MAPAATATNPAGGPAPITGKNSSRIQPDPEVIQYPNFDVDPVAPEEFFKRAEQVSDLLHEDEAIRDRGNVVPYRQVQLLKDSGLVILLGPKSAGGAGLTWKEAYKGLCALRYRCQEEEARRVDHKEQHPDDPAKLIFTGKKTFSTGSKISDVTILEGALPDGSHVFAPVLSQQPGIIYGDEWVDTLGMRGTQSGGIQIKDVVVNWEDALGFGDDKKFQPLGPYNTLNLPQIQLVFTSFYLGIAEGYLARALVYTKANTRGWPYIPSPTARGTDEAYIQIGYGDLQALLWASEAQIEKVVEEASAILHTEPRSQVTAEQRAHFAVHVAAAKLNIVNFGLQITSQIYELTGARAVAGKYGFDVAYRGLRTHSLHDPIAHKRAEVGRYALHGPGQYGWPTPTWYT